MPIKFSCPHCQHPYLLKDEFAGRRALCKNPACKRELLVPQPNAALPPPPPPKPTSAEIEAAALAALADEAKAEEAKPTVIDMTCAVCETKWTEPAEKAGKNVLCPECQHRQKVPVPQSEKGKDWRAAAAGPSLAKENFERPADVMGGEARIVSKEAWTQGGGAEQELEPLSVGRRLMWAAVVAAPLLLLLGGGYYAWSVWSSRGQDRFVEEAAAEFAADDWAPAEAPVAEAVLHTAAGEYELTHTADRDKAVKKAADHFAKARRKLQEAAGKDDPKRPTGPERAAAAAELAAAQVGLGGTDAEVKAGERYRWQPEAPTGRPLRVNERPVTVFNELQLTLGLLQGADFDTKMATARRLARDLARRGGGALAGDLVVMLFSESQYPEARAAVALELLKHDPAAELPRQVADDLRGLLEKGGGNAAPFPASAQTLWRVLKTDKAPALLPDKVDDSSPDPARFALVGQHLLEGRAAEALALATRPGGTVGGRLRALALCAEWSDPGPAVSAAREVVEKAGKDVTLPAGVVHRLVQLAAAGGQADAAQRLADALADEGLRVWAKGDIARLGPPAAADEAAVPVPENPKELRAAHAWHRLNVARQATRATGDRAKVKATADGWGKPLRAFGLAGIGLGLKDR